MTTNEYLVVGAGFSGAVIARELVERRPGIRVTVIDRRDHIAGNCHTTRDAPSGVMVHRYGPHIFNTDSERVWNYLQRFGVIRPYINRVKAVTPRGVYSLPINLHTINQFFGTRFDPVEARTHVAMLGDTSIAEPKNFEEQALRMMGRDLYENFFLGYTLKQWGCDPKDLPASILKRLPMRFNYDDNYYDKRFQGIPENGYTDIVAAILDHPGIRIELSRPFLAAEKSRFRHVFYTGPIDGWFDYRLGRLGYRTIYFEQIDAEGDYQGNAVLNYPGRDVPWTRIHEHKHFAPWEKHERTVAFREFSRETASNDTPYYPKRLAADVEMVRRYRALAAGESGVTFLGRLATYRYMDMETVIGEALDYADRWLAQPSSAWAVFPNSE